MDHTTRQDSATAQLMEQILYEVNRVVVGQDRFLERVMVAILAQGHLLVEGVPGLAKTLTIKTLANTIRGQFKRIQFTPDLVPSDLVGTRIYNQKTGDFSTALGPVFTNLLLADEINRAPAKVQSALLEVMQERQVTIAGETHKVPSPFLVMATQNPIETEGTYPLPEAQLDRFLLQIDVGYPSAAEERTMLLATTGAETDAAEPAMAADALVRAQTLVRRVPVAEGVVAAILDLVRGARPETAGSDEVRRHVAWGPGPRAAQALMLASRARAVLDGRLSPSVDDVAALAPAVLRHRMALNFSARADGVTLDGLIAGMVGRLG